MNTLIDKQTGEYCYIERLFKDEYKIVHIKEPRLYNDDVIKGMEIPNELKDNISIIPYTKRGGGFVMG
jgi:hypothetical protein